ncbi:MAG: hypothetical protein ISR65_01965 [Bacteriovoracaceae bacterium]|nr:hypothetical protein [Bacteriovoracaceae bacterium]
MTHPLGIWAAIDIETTGIDPVKDSIIDLGYLQFEGTKLIKKYSSLVQFDGNLSYFIQKLTGISANMLHNAPSWDEVELHLQELFGHSLLAHNASFEQKFLEQYFDDIDDGNERESFEDTLYYLALLFPDIGSLKLENFITGFGLRDGEVHRGLEDSVDLLRVILVATKLIRRDKTRYQFILESFKQNGMGDLWFCKFFKLPESELTEIAQQIDFNLEEVVEKIPQGKISVISDEGNQKDQDSLNDLKPRWSFEFNGENIKNILTDEQKVQEVFPQYKFRKSQLDLSLKVGQSFKNNVHSLVQAPTGTGKTLGYLLPVALFALNEDRQILVATGTKTLQHQAMTKDVPQIKKLLGLKNDDLRIRRLIGSSNHFCELLFNQNKQETNLLAAVKSFEEKFTEMFFELVFFHNSLVGPNEVITRGDIPYVLKKQFKYFHTLQEEIAVDFRACSGKNCPFVRGCGYIAGLQAAKDAEIIVGNHALMFSWPKGFPRPMHVVIDEAHKIEGEVTNAFSLEVSQIALTKLSDHLVHLQGIGSLFYLLSCAPEGSENATELINEIRDEAQKVNEILQDHLEPLEDLVEQHFKKLPRFTSLYWNEVPMFTKDSNKGVAEAAILNHLTSVQFVITEFYNYLFPYQERWSQGSLVDKKMIMAFSRFESFMGQLEDLITAFDLSLGSKEGYAHSLKYHEEYGYTLFSAPIDVGRVLHDGVLQPSSSVVCTSATLGNANGDHGTKGIEWASGHLYLDGERRFRTGFYLPAVFDYKNKAKVFLCDDTLPLYDTFFVEKTLVPIMKLIRKLDGKSLLLFSAKTRFEVAREILIKEFEAENPVFIQGMGNKVVDDFKNTSNGILLGMESFGEGIDIPGESLQFLFIDKIPDIRMDLVINKRRDFYERTIGNEFTDYFMAHRARSLHQKLGRLLRTEQDFGAAIIVDSRIRKWKGNTIQKLYKLMEPYQINRSGLDAACKSIPGFLQS